MRRPWLAPLVPLYAAGLAFRNLRLRRGSEPVRKLGWPVISIGNLSTGGSGKTPLTIALAGLLQSRGLSVDVLSRGYGRASSEPARVDPHGAAEQYGDEPLLMAGEAGVPVYVAPKRYDAGLLAEADAARKASGQDVPSKLVHRAHILDDGFQHRQLHRAVDILLVSREDWEDTLLPAGNLREPLHAAVRAQVIAIPADDAGLEDELRRWGWNGPVWRLHRRMNVPRVAGPVFAFCGIARPEQFFAGLESTGLQIVGRKPFRDHYDYCAHVVGWIAEQARLAGARSLLTTEKDAVRLGTLTSVFPADLPLETAKLHVEIENSDAAIDGLLAYLVARESPHPL